jgi:acyl carrier protein
MSDFNNIYEVIFEDFDLHTDLETSLEDLNFDSMAQILLIGELEDRYQIIIDAESFKDLITLKDLSKFLKSTI